MAPPKQLRIDWIEIEGAFAPLHSEAEAFGESGSYLDLETGRVIFTSDDLRWALDRIESELADELPTDAEVTAEVIRGTRAFATLPEWEQEVVLAVADLRFGDISRFEPIPYITSRESYAHMADFIQTVADRGTRDRLEHAIGQRKPFSRFREALSRDRRLEHQWHAYRRRREHEAMVEWLRSVGVEPANPDEGKPEPAPLPDLRKIMLAEVLWFVRSARDLPGVTRIALIGSLADQKEFPKDIDLLVTVTGDCDLAPLATLGRKLCGHMQAHQAGADVFLADPQGEYLGRTCPWRRCGPGIRVSCDALNCGRRQYLHDDLPAIRLNKKLIANPPVILWPQLAANEDVPRDVRDELIGRLARDREGSE